MIGQQLWFEDDEEMTGWAGQGSWALDATRGAAREERICGLPSGAGLLPVLQRLHPWAANNPCDRAWAFSTLIVCAQHSSGRVQAALQEPAKARRGS